MDFVIKVSVTIGCSQARDKKFFYDVTPCSRIRSYRRFGGNLINIYRTTELRIPEHRTLHIRHSDCRKFLAIYKTLTQELTFFYAISRYGFKYGFVCSYFMPATPSAPPVCFLAFCVIRFHEFKVCM